MGSSKTSQRPSLDFDAAFKALTGHPPFPWQRRLYQAFISGNVDGDGRPANIPSACALPTGLGKTSVVAVWLLALASGAKNIRGGSCTWSIGGRSSIRRPRR